MASISWSFLFVSSNFCKHEMNFSHRKEPLSEPGRQCAYMHTYIHTIYAPDNMASLSTFIHTCIHAYIHATHTYIHTYIRTYLDQQHGESINSVCVCEEIRHWSKFLLPFLVTHKAVTSKDQIKIMRRTKFKCMRRTKFKCMRRTKFKCMRRTKLTWMCACSHMRACVRVTCECGMFE